MTFARLTALLILLVLAACGQREKLEDRPEPLGDMKLGLNIVVTDKMQKVPISRDATAEEWSTAVKKAVAERFGRYDGDRFFNIGISVDAYALAPPGIPLVASPKSVLVVTATVFDDEKGIALNDKGERFTVFESIDGKTVLGSGLTKSKDQQIATLAFNAAEQVERWMRTHPEWFGTYSGGGSPTGPVSTGAAASALEARPAPVPAAVPAGAAGGRVIPDNGLFPPASVSLP